VPTVAQLEAVDPSFALDQDSALQAMSVYFQNWCAGYAQGDWASVSATCSAMSDAFGWGKQPIGQQLLGGLLIVGAVAAPYACLLGVCEWLAGTAMACATRVDCSNDLEALLSDNPGTAAGSVTINRELELAGMLGKAASNKGFSGIGAATQAEADLMGKAWVGDGYTLASDGKTMISKDKLRQFRPPSFKPNLPAQYGGPGYQANFEWRLEPSGQWQSDAHLNITDMP
jgi:hypothetical protein